MKDETALGPLGPLGAGRKEGHLLVGAGVAPAWIFPASGIPEPLRSPTLEAGLSEPGTCRQDHSRTGRGGLLFKVLFGLDQGVPSAKCQ